jgi:capsular exopolysaccharide synthesis family protein
MPRPSDKQPESSLASDLRGLYFALREKLWLLAIITAIGIAVAAVVVMRSKKIYAATTTIQIEEERQRVIRTDTRGMDGRSSEEEMKTIVENLESPALMLRLARHPELVKIPAFSAEIAGIDSEPRLQAIVRGKVSVKIRLGTRLIDITAEDESPVVAQKLSQLVVSEFMSASWESGAQDSRGAHEFLRQEADRLKQTLAKSEEALQHYKEQNQAVSLEEKQNIVVERLKDLNTKVTAAKAERLKIETDRAQLENLANASTERLLMLPSIGGAAGVVEVQRKITEKEAELATLSRRYKPEHPKYLEAAGTLQGLKTDLGEAVLKAASLLSTAFDATKANEEKLEAALRGQEHIALELSEMAISYKSLARDVEADRTLYESLVARLKETNVAQGVSRFAVRVATPALLPERPVKPKKALILLFGALGSLALASSGVLAAHALDGSFKTVDQAERRLGLASLAAIPKQPRSVVAGSVLVKKPQSALAESFRTLRTSLRITGKDAGSHAVLFASAIPAEGKSFCAINCAVAFAQQGLRTLLIDADLRLPTVERILLKTEGAPGLSDLLLGQAHLGKAIHLTGIKNLSVMPAGKRVPNLAELFGRSELPAFLQGVAVGFDRVVIDSAPVLAVSDTLLLAPHVGTVCLVVRARTTPGHAAVRAVEKLRECGAKISGFVLNALPTGNGGYYYHYQAPGYGSDEVYGASAALADEAPIEPARK